MKGFLCQPNWGQRVFPVGVLGLIGLEKWQFFCTFQALVSGQVAGLCSHSWHGAEARPAERTFCSFKRNTCSSATTAPTTVWNVWSLSRCPALPSLTPLCWLPPLLNLDPSTASVVARFLRASLSPVCLAALLTVPLSCCLPCPLTVQQ